MTKLIVSKGGKKKLIIQKNNTGIIPRPVRPGTPGAGKLAFKKKRYG